MKIEHPEKFYLTEGQRREIEKQIEFYKSEEKRQRISCLYLLKRTSLENKLGWDDYLKNGCQYSKKENNIFNKMY